MAKNYEVKARVLMFATLQVVARSAAEARTLAKRGTFHNTPMHFDLETTRVEEIESVRAFKKEEGD